MASLLVGKSAAITGGVTGIGKAIALEFLRQGATVTVNYLDDRSSREHFDRLRSEVPDKTKLLGLGGDIGKKSTGQELVDAAVSCFGGLDIFVANAGVSQFRDFIPIDEATFESHLHTNIRGTFWSTQAAAKYMIKQRRGGSILGISSISAHLGGAQQSQAYALGKHGIRCNALLPGTTRTQLAASDLANLEKLKYLEQRTPLGRVADPEDMAGPAVFLASDLSKFVSGAQILVDGGISISLQ